MKEIIELEIQILKSKKRKIEMEIERLEYLQRKKELISKFYIPRFNEEQK